MRRHRLAIRFSHCALVLLALSTAARATPAEGHTEILLEPAWLAANLDRDDVLIVDTRTPAAFARGHIAGAVNIPVAATFGRSPRDDLLAPISQIKRVLSNAGIRREYRLVLYDDGRFIDAARVFWALEVYGHPRVSILNVGYDAWRAAALPVTSEAQAPPPSNYIPSIDPRRLATRVTTTLALRSGNKVLIDARSAAEFNGLESIATRRGHIPGARNIPWSDLLVEDAQGHSRIRPLPELAARFSDLPRDRRVIAYCNIGQHASLTYLSLRALGYDVATYDGSWLEWGNDASLPIE